MTDYVPIPCADYEVLELACMDRYDVQLALADRETSGRAIELDIRAAEEFLVLEGEDGATESVRVDRIRELKVLSRPARFENHTFVP